MREYNTAPVSKARDGKLSTKSGTSSETDTATAVESAESVGSAGSTGTTAKPVESELELKRITARDEAYGRPKWTDTSKFGSSRR